MVRACEHDQDQIAFRGTLAGLRARPDHGRRRLTRRSEDAARYPSIHRTDTLLDLNNVDTICIQTLLDVICRVGPSEIVFLLSLKENLSCVTKRQAFCRTGAILDSLCWSSKKYRVSTIRVFDASLSCHFHFNDDVRSCLTRPSPSHCRMVQQSRVDFI